MKMGMKIIRTSVPFELIERWVLGGYLDKKEKEIIAPLEQEWGGFYGCLDHSRKTEKSLYFYDEGKNCKINSVCFRKE